MFTPVLELEDTWEEIAPQVPDFNGHKLRVKVEVESTLTPLIQTPKRSMSDALREIEARSRFMNPKPDTVDLLREARSGAMFGLEPME